MKSCPCGSGRPYHECCEPYIIGAQKPATAEALMRSRYSAYVEHAVDYIINTCVSDGKEKIDRKETQNWSEKSTWLGLSILSVSQGGEEDTAGTVEFEAVYERDGLKETHHETASFKKLNGQWLYDEGKVTPQTVKRDGPKTGRNEPCPCGSGKKYKHCHGR
ncbi:MAG: YchJ family protein [Treponema sp.]|jgi:SEC-C motif-containing protein|nr:YchJ family protein [Treponema sp.]